MHPQGRNYREGLQTCLRRQTVTQLVIQHQKTTCKKRCTENAESTGNLLMVFIMVTLEAQNVLVTMLIAQYTHRIAINEQSNKHGNK